MFVSRLTPVPDTGWTLIKAALSNGVVGTRTVAIRVLKSRPLDTWPPGLLETIRETAWRDPYDKVRKDARELIATVSQFRASGPPRRKDVDSRWELQSDLVRADPAHRLS